MASLAPSAGSLPDCDQLNNYEFSRASKTRRNWKPAWHFLKPGSAVEAKTCAEPDVNLESQRHRTVQLQSRCQVLGTHYSEAKDRTPTSDVRNPP